MIGPFPVASIAAFSFDIEIVFPSIVDITITVQSQMKRLCVGGVMISTGKYQTLLQKLTLCQYREGLTTIAERIRVERLRVGDMIVTDKSQALPRTLASLQFRLDTSILAD